MRRIVAGACIAAVAALLVAALATGRAIEPLDTMPPDGPLRDSTLDHSDARLLPAKARAVVIGEGHASLRRYEIVAYAARVPRDMRDSVAGAKVATCIDRDVPAFNDRADFDRTCFGPEIDSPLHVSGLSEEKRLGRGSRYILSGETSKRVAGVAVSYREGEGRVAAPGSYGLVTRRVAAATGIRYRAGQFVAFLPVDVQPESFEVTAYDSEGRVLDADAWGDR
jgi:hypothetical protein